MSLRSAPRAATLVVAAALCALITGAAAAQPMGKTKEYRSLNTDLYKISIQKNGQVDVFLANDTPVITDAFPMIWFDGEAEPERLKTSGKWTERLAVEDKLGQGQGVIHQHGGWEWSLRAYPTRPYFAVQLGYTNQSKKPVRVKALLPWCVGAPGKGMLLLGPGTNEARILSGTASGAPGAAQGAADSNDVIAVLNAATGQSLIAGFITQDHARGLLDIAQPVAEKKKAPSALGRFRAISEFNPPIELAPGASLYSEVLYLAISEPEPAVGLQRYARAVQVVNGFSGPGHTAPLHAWAISSEDAGQSSAALADRLRRVRNRVPLEAIGRVLFVSPDDSATNIERERSIAEAIRAAGYTPVLWHNPLRSDSARGPAELRALGARLHEATGVSEIAGLGLDGAVPAMREAVKALREGLGSDARLYGSAPSLLAGTLLDGVITTAADGLYFSPQPARHSVVFPRDAARAELSAATLLGCGLILPLPSLGEDNLIDLVARMLPSPTSAARPIDLFAAQPPRAFHLHSKVLDGDVHVAAVLNRDGASPLSMALPLARLGFTRGAYYTVYDYWRREYLGTAADTLDVTIPASDAAVLVFRPFLGHPMLVSTGTNLGQDFPTLRRADWDPQARTLTVELAQAATAGAASRFTLAVPAPYRLIGATSTTPGDLTWETGKTSVTITLPMTTATPQGFVARFDVNR